MICKVYGGGPIDGGTVDLDDDVECHEEVSASHTTTEGPVRRARKVYLYERNDTYRSRLDYVGEDVVWDDEEVNEMGFRKHGVGEVLPDAQTQHTASQSEDWDDKDEQALADENKD